MSVNKNMVLGLAGVLILLTYYGCLLHMVLSIPTIVEPAPAQPIPPVVTTCTYNGQVTAVIIGPPTNCVHVETK